MDIARNIVSNIASNVASNDAINIASHQYGWLAILLVSNFADDIPESTKLLSKLLTICSADSAVLISILQALLLDEEVVVS